MKILYLKTAGFDNSAIGGSITHTLGMINGFVDSGADVTVLTSDEINLIRAKQEIIKIKSFRKIPYLYNYIYAKRMKKGIQKWLKNDTSTYDFLYYRYALFFDAGLLIEKKKEISSVLEFNSFQTDSFRDMFIETAKKTQGKLMNFFITVFSKFVIRLIKKYEDKVITNTSKFITVSEVNKNELINRYGIKTENIQVIPNGVDTDIFKNDQTSADEIRRELNIPHERIVAGFAGTFGNWHGIPELTDAVLQTANRKNLFFLIMGSGPMLRYMQERLSGLTNIYFTGVVPYGRMSAYLSACDILILSNSWNPPSGKSFFGSPTKLFEYMAMGKAIAATKLGQTVDILEHEKNALLCESGDESGLTAAILRYADDSELRALTGATAREDVIKKHTWKSNAVKVVIFMTGSVL